MYETVLFDLDGTIVNSSEGIINSFTYAFKKFGLPVPPREEMSKFIGPPLLYSFETICGLSRAEAEHAVEVYREYYAAHGVYEICAYEGMGRVFRLLKMNGKKIVLATSKYELFAVQILKEMGFLPFFDFTAGSLKSGARGTKKEVIEYALTAAHADKKSAVMVGDRMHDIQGAREAGIDSIGVLFGFGTREELVSHGATYIAEKPEDIFNIICGK